jgi:hypothetical protein
MSIATGASPIQPEPGLLGQTVVVIGGTLKKFRDRRSSLLPDKSSMASAAAAFTIYRSILNPIFSLTWNSSTLPSLILPLSSSTLNHSM